MELVKRMSLFERIKNKIRVLFISDAEVRAMKQEIIKELKPVFIEMIRKRRENDILDELAIAYFDERINTLPKHIIIELYDDLQHLKSLKNEQLASHKLINIIAHINLLYSLNGWFIKKVMKELQKF